jgi:hypothetical protein
MSDETTTSERVGFCQDCGKPLSKETVRVVGQGVFCEPCLHARLTANQSAPQPAPSATGYTAPAAAPSYTGGEPHPWLAATLGVIPGVGAMYNGQFIKGLIHLVIFAVLVSLKEHVSDVFGIFVFAWICFMSFEAYHTARARRDGLPLPDAFGLNDIGEKMGFGKTWSTVGQVRPQAPVTPPPATSTAAASAPAPAATPGANRFGYVPPASASYPAGTGNAPYSAPVPPAPYTSPYSAGQAPNVAMPNVTMPPMPAPGSSFPLLAVWLIGLGVLFALGEWVPMWHVNSSSIVAILLGAMAASVFVRRLGYMGGMSYHGPLLHMMRGPMILAVWAVLFLLQGVHAATIGQTWPVFLLALGAVLLGERLGMGAESYAQHSYDAAPASVVPPPTPAATTSTDSEHGNERDGFSR